ncbi:MAG: DUF4397 domain-containing protein [Flavobacteriales bacterium]
MNRKLFSVLIAAGMLTSYEAWSQARVQVIHNSADAAAAVVDVYINGGAQPAINDFAFRTATPFIDLPAGVDLTIGIAPGNSTGPQDIITALNTTVNLADGETYVVVANGIVSPTGYTPATPFQLYVQAAARETATSGAGNTDILVFHGCTDAPVVDVAETAVLGGATIVDDLAYGAFDGYLEVPTLDFTLQVQTADGTPLLNYLAPLQTLGLEGTALTVVASGFLDPSVNSNGAGFGLWVALPTGGNLVQLPIATSIADNSVISSVSAWPNPANDLLTVDVETSEMLQAEVRLTDMTGRVVRNLAGSSLANGANRLVLDVTGLATGSYSLSVVGDRAIRTLPVQIVR